MEARLRTLVVSDLHLGARTGRDILRRAEPRGVLLRTLANVDRLVLLGDVLEMRQGPVREALAAAEEPLREVGAALPAGARVVLVPGNHDHLLLSGWLARRARRGAPPPIGLSSQVDWRAGEPLARLARWLAPAELEVAYPGVWLREDVYALHGHYGDRHTTVPMLERLAAGAMARIVGDGPGGAAGPRSCEDYEAILGPMYAWIDALAQTDRLGRRSHGASTGAWRALTGSGRRGLRRRVLAAAFPAVIAGLNRAGVGPLRADLSAIALRRAALAAAGEVVLRLGVDARHVIFGHTHRAGPLATDDDQFEWRAVSGPRLVNCGCWVHEPTFLGADPAASPYRAGFCVRLEDRGEPCLINLLDPGS